MSNTDEANFLGFFQSNSCKVSLTFFFRKKLVHKVVNAYAVNAVAILAINSPFPVIYWCYGFAGNNTMNAIPETPSDPEITPEMQAWLFFTSVLGSYALGWSPKKV